MTLPLVRGYPAMFSISQAAINRQYATQAETGVFSSQWSDKGSDWLIEATVGAPYIDFSTSFPQSIRLNYPVKSGQFKSLIQNAQGKYDWQPYSLEGVVFYFITPTRLIQDSHFDDDDLTAQSIFIDLDSPHLQTIVETSKAVNTTLPDDIKTTVAQRVQDYVRDMAKKNPNQFMIASSLTAASVVNHRGGCLEPTGANFSVFEQFDNNYPDTDSRHSARSTINWLLSMPATATSSSPEAGKLDVSPLPGNEEAAMTVSGFALLSCVVMPAVARATGIPEGAFSSNDQITMRTNGRYGNLDSVVIYPAGDHIQVDYKLSHTETKDIVIVSASVTLTATWSTNVTFYQDGPDVRIRAENTKPVTHTSGDTHIFGIPMPSFVDDLFMDIAKGIAGGPNIQTPAVQALTEHYLRRFRVLGGQRFELNSVQMLNGNLVLGLLVGPYRMLPCQNESAVRSIKGDEIVGYRFINRTGDTVKTYWVDYQGKLAQPGVLENNGIGGGNSYVTNVFTVHDRNDKCIQLYRLASTGGPNHQINIYIEPFNDITFADKSELSTLYTGSKVTINATNQTKGTITMDWFNEKGERVHYNTLNSGASVRQDTAVGHVWGFYNANNQCLRIYRITATGDPNNIVQLTLA